MITLENKDLIEYNFNLDKKSLKDLLLEKEEYFKENDKVFLFFNRDGSVTDHFIINLTAAEYILYHGRIKGKTMIHFNENWNNNEESLNFLVKYFSNKLEDSLKFQMI